MLEIKNTVTQMKKASDGVFNKMNIAAERISELEEMSVETSKTEMEIEKRMKKKRIPKKCGTIIKGITYT